MTYRDETHWFSILVDRPLADVLGAMDDDPRVDALAATVDGTLADVWRAAERSGRTPSAADLFHRGLARVNRAREERRDRTPGWEARVDAASSHGAEMLVSAALMLLPARAGEEERAERSARMEPAIALLRRCLSADGPKADALHFAGLRVACVLMGEEMARPVLCEVVTHTVEGESRQGRYTVRFRGPAGGFVMSDSQMMRYRAAWDRADPSHVPTIDPDAAAGIMLLLDEHGRPFVLMPPEVWAAGEDVAGWVATRILCRHELDLRGMCPADFDRDAWIARRLAEADPDEEEDA